MCAQWILPLQWKYVQHKHSISNINSAHAGHQVQQVKKLFKVLETCSFQYCTHYFFFCFITWVQTTLPVWQVKKSVLEHLKLKKKHFYLANYFFCPINWAPKTTFIVSKINIYELTFSAWHQNIQLSAQYLHYHLR